MANAFILTFIFAEKKKMKATFLFIPLFILVIASCSRKSDGTEFFKSINRSEFISLIADYEDSPSSYKGDKPCVIDFYADWCQPCKKLSPKLNKMAAEFGGSVCFYKINVDSEPDIADSYDVNTIPAVFICHDNIIEKAPANVSTIKDLLNQILKKD